jgi:hypothetical protein
MPNSKMFELKVLISLEYKAQNNFAQRGAWIDTLGNL